MSLSDADIMARVQAGDREVFGVLVRRYAVKLLRVADSKLGDAALAEDLVQETFLSAYRARASYNPRFAVSTWLWTILLNLCRRHWQRTRRRSVSLWEQWNAECPEPSDDEAPSPLSLLIAGEDRRRLHEMLAQLPEPQADALRLRFFGGLAFEEIAATMECSLSGAKRRVKTGLERLSNHIRSLEQTDASAPPLRQEDQRQ
jgi:RNA polymerase sigma-70 factor, ECF subfamily